MEITKESAGRHLNDNLLRLQKENPAMCLELASLYVEGYRDALASVKGPKFAEETLVEMTKLAKEYFMTKQDFLAPWLH